MQDYELLLEFLQCYILERGQKDPGKHHYHPETLQFGDAFFQEYDSQHYGYDR